MKVLTTLNLNDPQVKRLVSSVDGKVKNGYMTFDEERVAGGTLKLHYQLSGGVRADNLELRFTPDDSNMQYTARTTGAMAAYRLRF